MTALRTRIYISHFCMSTISSPRESPKFNPILCENNYFQRNLSELARKFNFYCSWITYCNIIIIYCKVFHFSVSSFPHSRTKWLTISSLFPRLQALVWAINWHLNMKLLTEILLIVSVERPARLVINGIDFCRSIKNQFCRVHLIGRFPSRRVRYCLSHLYTTLLSGRIVLSGTPRINRVSDSSFTYEEPV